LIQDRHIGYFWFKTGTSNIICVQSTICDIITKTKYYFRYLLKLHGAHREIYKTTGVSIVKKKLWFLILRKKNYGGGLATPRPNGGG
jgi:hypothetical protein